MHVGPPATKSLIRRGFSFLTFEKSFQKLTLRSPVYQHILSRQADTGGENGICAFTGTEQPIETGSFLEEKKERLPDIVLAVCLAP